MRMLMWRVKLWWLRQMLLEASRMSLADRNIALNDIDDHIRRMPK